MTNNTWLEIDRNGLCKTLGQKDKVFILNEMVSNAWDEEITHVDVTLTPPDQDVAPTDIDVNLNKVVPPNNWTPAMEHYAGLVERIAPWLIGRVVTVQYIDDDDDGIQGSPKWKEGQMTINLAYHDIESDTDNCELLIHELAHNTLHNNNHLHKIFYDTVTQLGARLAIFALKEPELLQGSMETGGACQFALPRTVSWCIRSR